MIPVVPYARISVSSARGVLGLPAQQVAGLALEHLAERGERREAHRLGAAVLEYRQVGGVIPTRSASSPTGIFRLASITSMSTAIGIRSPRPTRSASAPLRRRARRPGRAASAARAR